MKRAYAVLVLRGVITALVAANEWDARAQAVGDYLPPKIDVTTATGVALSDGSLSFTNTDVSLGPLVLERYYLGGIRDPSDPFFGPRMSHNFDMYVARNFRSNRPYEGASSKPFIHLGRGAVGTFLQAYPNNSFVIPWTPDALGSALTFSEADITSGYYEYTAHDGTVYLFTGLVAASPPGSQRISTIKYQGGRTLKFIYNSAGKLKEIEDNHGYALVFDYNSAGDVSAACGFNLAVTYVSVTTTCAGAALRSSYGYDSSNRLISYTDVVGQVTIYQYSSASALTCIKPPGNTVCRISNVYGTGVSAFQVTQQTLADGSVWQYASTLNPIRDAEKYLIDDGSEGSVVTDPLNNTANYRFTGSAPYRFTDALGRVTEYRYSNNYDTSLDLDPASPPNDLHDGSLLLSADFPEGNRYEAEYTGPFRSISKESYIPKPNSGLLPAIKQYLYGPCTDLKTYCTQPIGEIDPDGNRTDRAFTSFGSLQWEMLPPPSAGAPRPLRMVSYVQRYASFRNSAGALVPASSSIWLVSSDVRCQAAAGGGAPACDANAPQIFTEYAYPAAGTTNNDLLPSSITVRDAAGATVATTAMTYDVWGNVTSIDGPRTDVADITYMTYDAMRRKVFEIGADPDGPGPRDRVIVRHLYGPDGQEVRTETGHGQATDGADFVALQYQAMSYDGMGRLVRTEAGRP